MPGSIVRTRKLINPHQFPRSAEFVASSDEESDEISESSSDDDKRKLPAAPKPVGTARDAKLTSTAKTPQKAAAPLLRTESSTRPSKQTPSKPTTEDEIGNGTPGSRAPKGQNAIVENGSAGEHSRRRQEQEKISRPQKVRGKAIAIDIDSSDEDSGEISKSGGSIAVDSSTEGSSGTSSGSDDSSDDDEESDSEEETPPTVNGDRSVTGTAAFEKRD